MGNKDNRTQPCDTSRCPETAAFTVHWSDPAGYTSDLCRTCIIDAVVVDGRQAPDVERVDPVAA